MLTFSVDSGYLDGIVRGYRSGFLTTANYSSLIQCETLEDFRLQLSATDYGPYLQYDTSTLTTTLLAERLSGLMIDQFKYLKENATQPLSQFLDFITYGYMIDNVMLLITGTLHEREANELLEKCHPLGLFDGMAALTTSTSPLELYNIVLVESPLAPYFAQCLSAKDLDDLHIELIRNTLLKTYLEDFYKFCSSLDDTTSRLMEEILMFEADRRVIDITINSFGTDLSKKDRIKLYPNIGHLYPEGILRMSMADDIEQVKSALSGYQEYSRIIDSVMQDRENTLNDLFLEREVQLNKRVFQDQFHYAGFYAYIRLKEQEIRNLIWIAECIAQNQRDRISKFIAIF
jgi:V-type H+-transporting ATPase subunit d